MQSVRSLIERLPFDRHGIAERNGGVFVRSRAPYLAVRNDFAPYLAAIGKRPVIVHGDVGDADALHHPRMLALPRQVKHQRFASSNGLRIGGETSTQQNTGQQNKQTIFVHGLLLSLPGSGSQRLGFEMKSQFGLWNRMLLPL